MEDGVSSFPLFNLPNGPLKRVLQNMDINYQIGFSILSKKSKELVRSLNLEVEEISVDISDLIYFEICSQNAAHVDLCFYTENLRHITVGGNVPSITEIYTPDFVRNHVEVDDEYKPYEWRKEGFEIKDWFDHFLTVVHCSKVDYLSFSGHTLFDLDSLQKIFTDVTEVKIEDNYPVTYIQKILQTFSSAINLDLLFQYEHNPGNFHSAICQNFDVLSVVFVSDVIVQKWKLDDFLMMNARSITFTSSTLSQKDVNKFLKHWIDGSNPRMEHFQITFSENINPNKQIILHGLDYQIVPPEHERTFQYLVEDDDGSSTVIVKGGNDIKRNDGTTGTIIIYEGEANWNFEFFVWP